MAPLPRPIGIDATLTDIATGIGNSARLLAGLSRSEIGAVAVKSARVRLDFQMSRIFDKSADGVELGVKTFSISAAQLSESSSRRAASQGVIELEIVAVATADLPVPASSPPKLQPGNRQREAIVRAIELLKQPAATASLGDAAKRKVSALVAKAEKAMQQGDLPAAAEAIAGIETLLANTADPFAAGAGASAPAKAAKATARRKAATNKPGGKG